MNTDTYAEYRVAYAVYVAAHRAERAAYRAHLTAQSARDVACDKHNAALLDLVAHDDAIAAAGGQP